MTKPTQEVQKEVPESFVISKAILISTLDYLATRPYAEVAQAIGVLSNLPPFIPMSSEAKE